MQTLKIQDKLWVGLTLFSMFFGAGNLIFPPLLGAQSGTALWLSMTGFCISAIGLPILGVLAVAKAGGLNQLAGRVGSKFAWWFSLLAYLSVGPGLAIPRTASTSFEMAVTPFVSHVPGWAIWAYSLAFFAVAMLVAFNPEKLTDFLGRFLAPCLLLLIGFVVVGCLLNPPGSYGAPVGKYAASALPAGFVNGYLTMDTIAALNSGIVISLNIQAKGVTDPRSVVRNTIQAGWIAGAVLLLVYVALGHVGAVSAGLGQYTNGAGVLTLLVNWVYGPIGSVLLGVVFVIACLNTCIGLLSSCSEYFYKLFPRLSYRAWVVVFAAISFFVSILGLDAILAVSIPVLNAIYPVAIALIVLGLTHKLWQNAPLCYPFTVAFTAFASVVYALDEARIALPLVTKLVQALPMYDLALGWVVPALVGCLAGYLMSLVQASRQTA